jgi:hypothetical protein
MRRDVLASKLQLSSHLLTIFVNVCNACKIPQPNLATAKMINVELSIKLHTNYRKHTLHESIRNYNQQILNPIVYEFGLNNMSTLSLKCPLVGRGEEVIYCQARLKEMGH